MRQDCRTETFSILDVEDIKAAYRLTGISSYRNTLVLWDEDTDTRVFDLIDDLTDVERQLLLAVHEHEGSVLFFWKSTEPPKRLERGVHTPDGDYWSAEHRCMEGRSSCCICDEP